MTYWTMAGRKGCAPVLEPPQHRRSYGIALPKRGDEETQWVQLRRYAVPQVCPHGHPIPPNEPVVEISPIWNPGSRVPTKRFCLNHAPVPQIKLLGFRPRKGR